jgi:hypothetical protein
MFCHVTRFGRRFFVSLPPPGGVLPGAENMQYFRAPGYQYGPPKAGQSGEAAGAQSKKLCAEIVDKPLFPGCSKRPRCKAQEKLKADAYLQYARI